VKFLNFSNFGRLATIRANAEHGRALAASGGKWSRSGRSPVTVKAIRKRLKMSPAEFSPDLRDRQARLREWEHGGWQPDSATRAYLAAIAKEPATV